MKKAKRDAVVMLILMIVSVLFYVWFIPAEVRVVANNKSSFTSRTFPSLMMIALFVMALIGFCKSFYDYRSLRKESAEKNTGMGSDSDCEAEHCSWKPLIAFILTITYGIMFKYVGCLLSTLIFVTAFLCMLRCRDWKYYIGCYVFCAALYFIFIQVLHVPLP